MCERYGPGMTRRRRDRKHIRSSAAPAIRHRRRAARGERVVCAFRDVTTCVAYTTTVIIL